MKAKHIRKLRQQIRHYDVYVLRNVDKDIGISSLDECKQRRHLSIYGKDAIDALKRYCSKHAELRYHIEWIHYPSMYVGDVLVIPRNGSFAKRFYLTW